MMVILLFSPSLSYCFIIGMARGLSILLFYKELCLGFIYFLLYIFYSKSLLLFPTSKLSTPVYFLLFNSVCFSFSGFLMWRLNLILALSSFIVWAFKAVHRALQQQQGALSFSSTHVLFSKTDHSSQNTNFNTLGRIKVI